MPDRPTYEELAAIVRAFAAADPVDLGQSYQSCSYCYANAYGWLGEDFIHDHDCPWMRACQFVKPLDA